MASADQALSDLLLSLFSADELRRFLRYGPEGDRIERALPGPTASATAVADDAVKAVRKLGLLDERFFDRLVEERERRARDVNAVRRLVVAPAAAPPSDAPPRHAPGTPAHPSAQPGWDFAVIGKVRAAAAVELARALASRGFTCRAIEDVAGVPWEQMRRDLFASATVILACFAGETERDDHEAAVAWGVAHGTLVIPVRITPGIDPPQWFRGLDVVDADFHAIDTAADVVAAALRRMHPAAAPGAGTQPRMFSTPAPEHRVSKPAKVFVSYAHEDEAHRKTLEKSLAVLKRQGIVSVWHDRQIHAGDEWKGEIDRNLEEADVILLLVSMDFLASDYCWDVEMKWAMERHKAGSARVIPIFVRACDWHGAPFTKLQGVPDPKVPIADAPSKDAAWTAVAKAIREVVDPR